MRVPVNSPDSQELAYETGCLFPSGVAHSALVHGSGYRGNAVYRHCDGFNHFVETCPAGGDPQTAGADDSGSGGGQAMAEVLYLRPFATGFHTGLAAPDSASLTLGVIPHDVPSAPDWLGDAVSGGVPHHPRGRGCFATHCSGE